MSSAKIAASTLLVAHDNTDFDALAGLVVAQRLYPGALIGRSRRLSPAVGDFWSLHKDLVASRPIDHVDLDTVERLVLVDVRDRRRLASVEPVLARRDAGEPVDVHVWDHHPPSGNDVVGDVHEIAPTGAVTTALVERLRDLRLGVGPVEATLFALAIHEDTASLTLGHTTPRDARALAWLLSVGADFGQLERYLHPPLSEAQRLALAELLASCSITSVGQYEVAYATIERPHGIDGFARVVSLARQLAGYDALFVEARTERPAATTLIARSRQAALDVGAVARALGGGGHRGAASAHVRGEQATGEVLRRALEHLGSDPVPRLTVAELMSRPVWAVAPECTLGEVDVLLEARGIQGAPVVRDGALIGVVSRSDVERARAADRLTLPASSYMSGRVFSLREDASLEEALREMVERDVGRLPVLDGSGQLSGIVSRSDVRRSLYQPGPGQ